ncbi:GntR family transcriptional regulator [Rhodococcus sp. Q]|uniref:FadR/GntR family transcriptional regulator n=1 Tax=Rhodococcus sp. Q TaxID=2502252 RepID=UPI0010F6F42C|nr:GntR family transcriptional regulator [Rhodococcus sp. Q]
MFEPIARTTTSAAVFDQISARVLGGDLLAGESLPSERHLAEAFGVSRPAVREAIQKLTQAGLVEVRQGESTSVRDFRRHAGPELLPHLLITAGTPDWAVARSVLEARRLIGVQVAGLAAARATTETDELLRDSLALLESVRDPVELQRCALVFWEHVVDAAESIAFRLIFNSLRNAYEPTMAALSTVMAAEVGRTDLYRGLATAIADRDADAAATSAATLLDLGTAALTGLIEQLDQTQEEQ